MQHPFVTGEHEEAQPGLLATTMVGTLKIDCDNFMFFASSFKSTL